MRKTLSNIIVIKIAAMLKKEVSSCSENHKDTNTSTPLNVATKIK